MTKLTFETAALADAIKKAAQVAPTTGQAFDKAAGILMEVDPSSETPCIVKATNTEVYTMEWVDVEEAEGEESKWRLPSRLFASVISSLPIGSGKSVTLYQERNQVFLKSGRTTAKFNMLDAEYYPVWGAFDPDSLSPVTDVGGRIAQVEWAAAKSEPPLSGVNFDGEYCVATDKYRMARAPLKISGLEESVTVPAGILGSLLKQTGEISLGFESGQLLIMPDEHSQIRCILFGLKYPNVGRAMAKELPDAFTARKDQLLSIMSRATHFAGADRFPVLECYIGKEEFAVMMKNQETGLLGDVVDLTGQATHPRVKVMFTPKNIMDPIEKAPNEEVTIFYDQSNSKAPFRIDGGSGYEAWAMPRADATPSGE